jgi:ribosomal protein L7/L12
MVKFWMILAIIASIGWLISHQKSQRRAALDQSPLTKNITDAEIEQLLHHGKKIQAIARYQQLHFVDLAKAKEMVDLLEQVMLHRSK